MPAVQTTYSQTMRPAVAGMQATMTPESVITRIAEGAIGFGVVVVKGTGDKQAKVPTAGGTFLGITKIDPTVGGPIPPVTADTYADKDVIQIMERGDIWVVVGASVTAGEPAYFVPATGVITNVSTSNTAIPNARFDTSAASGALAVLKLK